CCNWAGTSSRPEGSGKSGWSGERGQSRSLGIDSRPCLHATRCPALASSIDTQRERSSLAKNRMREICTSGSVGGEGGNVLTYPATMQARFPGVASLSRATRHDLKGREGRWNG